MIGTLNLGSLVFGILAWFIPSLGLMKQSRRKISSVNYMIISFVFMGFSLLFQLMVQQALVAKNDFVAMMDTIDMVVLVSVILVFGTILANSFMLYGLRKKAPFDLN